MEEEIIGAIAEAEQRATEIRERAAIRAAEIAAQAEAEAQQIAKASEESCKAYRDAQIAAAEQSSRKAYAETVSARRTEAEDYADEILNKTEVSVVGIVRRIFGDR